MAAETAALPAAVAAAVATDPHRPGSVDHHLLTTQVVVTPANQAAWYRPPGSPPAMRSPRPYLQAIVSTVTADAVHAFQRASALRRWVAAVPRTFPEGGRSTHAGFWGNFETFLCGGTEEEVIKKGSPLAAELARVLVTLAHLAGLPARLAFLYADDPPVRHCVAEIYVAGRWSVFDPISDRSFAWSKHGYASAWDIHLQPWLLDGLRDHARLPYVAARFYRTVALALYDPWDPAHDFSWDPLDRGTAARLLTGEAS